MPGKTAIITYDHTWTLRLIFFNPYSGSPRYPRYIGHRKVLGDDGPPSIRSEFDIAHILYAALGAKIMILKAKEEPGNDSLNGKME